MKCPRCARDYEPGKDGKVCWFCFYRFEEGPVAHSATQVAGVPDDGRDGEFLFQASVPSPFPPQLDQVEEAKAMIVQAIEHMACATRDLGFSFTSEELESARRHIVYAHGRLKDVLDGGELKPLK